MPRTRQLLQAFKTFVLLLAVAWVKDSSLAGGTDYLMDVWTSDNELPDSSVSSIAQTPDGYLWVGTANGLARFDGVRFVTFDPVNTPELKDARITGLFLDAWGTLWINTHDGSMTSLRNGVFTREWQGGQVSRVFSISNQLILTIAGHHSAIVSRMESGAQRGKWQWIFLGGPATGNNFKEDGDGAIWYTANKSQDLYRIEGTNSERMAQDSGWHGKFVTCMTTDSEGRFWIGTDEGIARWNNGRFEDWTPTNGPANVNVSLLCCTTNGCLVFGDGKVRKCANRQWVAEVDAKSWRDLVGAFILDLNVYEDRDAGVWFAHYGSGLFHIKADGTTEHLSTDNGLPSNLLTCWFQDREGNIWVGLKDGGLVRLRKKQFQVIGPPEGLTTLAVSSICEDGQSNIWIGTSSGGLYRWRDGNLDRFELPSGANKESFYSVYPDSENRLWLSAGREDLFTFENGQFIPGKATVHGIKAVLADRQGRVWFGKLIGLSYLFNGRLKSFPPTNGLNDIRCLAEDAHGGIWIGTGNGDLLCRENGKLSRYKPNDGQEGRPIWSLLPENDGTLWVGTFRGGLLRFKDGKFTRYTTQDGLPNDIICQILEDRMGNLWIGSHKGIFCVAKDSFKDLDEGKIQWLPCLSYGLSDGLPALECSGNYQPACWRDHDDRLWFATVMGPVSVLPRELSINHLAPPVIIEEVLVDGKPHELSSSTSPFIIAPGGHQLDLRFTALSFAAPDKVAFRYKLAGLDANWVDGGTKRSVHYGALRPGKYRFQVIACNNDGVWNETGATMDLEVQPHFWQTWWFDCLVIMLAFGSIAGTVRVVSTRKLQRKLERLQQQHDLEHERERIAKDIHDDLGTGLTRIMLQSALAQRNPAEQAQALGRISATAHELVGAMDEIVWAINPENDTLDGLVTYIGKFVQEFAAQAGMRCQLDLPVQVPSLYLSAETRHNLFLAVKEALNNIAKHARATDVGFSLKLQPSGFAFVVKDNGCGFNPNAATVPMANENRIASGNGLRNLVYRLEKIGGRCRVGSEPGKGTEVELTVEVQNAKQRPRIL